jgi:hypothetical protein
MQTASKSVLDLNEQATVTLSRVCCGECGVTFAVPEKFLSERRYDQKTFYCPNGHPRAFCRSERQELEQRIARKTAELDQMKADRDRQRELREAEERSHAATRGQVTKLKKRAAAGVCPCCNRTFQELARHMANKHPDFNAPKAE